MSLEEHRVKIVYAADGTPGVLAEKPVQAFEGLGFIHGRHRPLQTLLLVCAGQGVLSEQLVPRADLTAIDTLVHRLDLVRIGEREAPLLDEQTRVFVAAYIKGLEAGLAEHPVLSRLVRPKITPAGLISSLMISAYLGLAEGQERMESAILDAIAAGADPVALKHMFSPHLAELDVSKLSHIGLSLNVGLNVGAFATSGGSNAWALTGARTANGHAMLCGDPHLQVNQMPGLFLEVALRVGDDYWLGATIPGLPGFAVGRNKRVAWSGTFGVADNVDLSLDHTQTTVREVEIKQRFKSPVRVRFFETPLGVVQNGVAHKWWGSQEPAAAFGAYMRLPMAQSADEAVNILDRALTLSLHFVIADAAGEARYRCCGHIPRGRTASALLPFHTHTDTYRGEELPRTRDVDGIIASANEARLGVDGGVLSTLAQPTYRLDRITQQLRARRDHDVASMQALQLDVYSLQANKLAQALASHLPFGSIRNELMMWDFYYTDSSLGATAYDRVYRAAVRALAPKLGGAWWLAALSRTEISVWWCNGIDSLLAQAMSEPWWHAAFLREIDHSALEPWGLAHSFSMPHLLFGPLASRGPFPLAGALTTIRQGNNVPALNGAATTAPAYRFITSLNDDHAYTSLAGGIDGSIRSASYDTWLDDWLDGRYHRLSPPK